MNLSLGYRDRDDESNDAHIDVETIGNAPSKVSVTFVHLFLQPNNISNKIIHSNSTRIGKRNVLKQSDKQKTKNNTK